jgi:transaldolase
VDSLTTELDQLGGMSVICVDSGDLTAVRSIGSVDSTTNPLFVSQAAQREDPQYVQFVAEAVSYARERSARTGEDRIELAIDRLTVNLGREITTIVPGVVSSEVDPRLSFDEDATVRRGKRIIEMYEESGVSRERILIKVAGTWEGCLAAERLEAEGIRTNITLVFSFAQAVAAAQRYATEPNSTHFCPF